MRPLTSYEVEHIISALTLVEPTAGILTVAESTRLLADFTHELARRERAASERNINPAARVANYNRAGAIITVYETPSPAQGVKAPRKDAAPRVMIDDVDALLMLVGNPDDLVPEA